MRVSKNRCHRQVSLAFVDCETGECNGFAGSFSKDGFIASPQLDPKGAFIEREWLGLKDWNKNNGKFRHGKCLLPCNDGTANINSVAVDQAFCVIFSRRIVTDR